MAKILAFAGSNSSRSINYKLVKHTVSAMADHEVRLLNMANFPFPMYSEDYERENGYSNSLVELKNDMAGADGIVISVNEHNGNPSAYFKNLLDWLSRLDRNFLEGKPILLMATSNGKRGAIGSLEVVRNMLPRFGGEVVETFSLPSFSVNLGDGDAIVDADLAEAHKAAVQNFLRKI
ncbi:NADPH-dependent FMN reductase [Pseudozobellia thermophila]|uniref:NAD(P)H-dependent FMN reductase n=1 Tax=Pseudozobellia thermophila TaxID=192903 RepID=A0A1M6N4S9_9FLAO|nr:NAD(P)H-dependent oxidoreductase [Pseudozobellia thermophila]SHJ90603.1 NAD(P)H-dependent FMN reductase [Pseudozobellia thermophila]